MSLEQAVATLEREIALLTWHLRAHRMTPMQHAIWSNSLVGRKLTYGIERRFDDLILEIRSAREAIERR